MISETCSFVLISNWISKSLMIKVIEIFFAGNSKENSKSLKLVSVPDTNKAWINKFGYSFLLKLLRTIIILLV